MAYSMRQIKAIEKANKERIVKVCPNATERSGIYCFYREENGLKFAYIGQAKNLLSRLAQHLTGFQHIDLSIKKRKLYSNENPLGWKIKVKFVDVENLDEAERKAILDLANAGYQLYNKTSGGQDSGKVTISDTPRKGYQEGWHKGYNKAMEEIKHLFDLHLDVGTKKNPPTKLQEKALIKFQKLIDK